MIPLCTSDAIVKGDTLEGEATPIRCKRWSCPTCAKINRARVIAIAKAAKPRAMLTLTVSSKHYDTPDAAAFALKRGLRLLRLRLKRSEKLQNFQFIAVFERHKSGYPHMHLLIRGKFLPWKDLKEMWTSITGSYRVDIRKIPNDNILAFYVAKYIGKDLSAFEGCKRWWRSHGYSEGANDNYEPEHRYRTAERYYIDINTLYFAMRLEGYTVEKDHRGTIRWRDPPDGGAPLMAVLASAQGLTKSRLAASGRRAGGQR